VDQDRKIEHALSSSYITDDLAWRVPVKVLEGHPVYGLLSATLSAHGLAAFDAGVSARG
jgi:hypothetical protein